MNWLVGAFVVLTGILAPASPGVLEGVEQRRIRYGWGLSEEAGPGVTLIAVEDCEHLGREGWLVVGNSTYQLKVVDCQCRTETPRLGELGIVADINVNELGHRQGTILLWPQ